MRSILFGYCLFIVMYAHSQSLSRHSSPDDLKQFVEPTSAFLPEKDATIRTFAFIGTITNQIHVLRKLADTIAIVQIQDTKTIASLSHHGKLIPVNDLWKFPPGFTIPATTEIRNQKQIWLITTVDDTEVVSHCNNVKDTVSLIHASGKNIQIKTSWNWIEDHLLHHPAIVFIAPVSQPYVERELTGFDLSANKGNLAHRIWPSLNGSGRTISIKENRFDTTDIDFKGRYITSSLASSRMETHATTMATIAAGGGNSFYTGKGFAYGASIASSDFANLLPDVFSPFINPLITVQNHSYGTGIENYYGADASAYDQLVSNFLSPMHIFSAGNQGTQSSTSGNYAGINGYANLTGSFKMSKNTIAVGATDSFGIVPALSSRGPAYDGRLKPELVALGEDGSSGAAAIVSGIIALLQQAYQEKHNQRIEPATVRAILFNSADDIGTAGPDFVSGYGMVNAYRAIQTIEENRFFRDLVKNQEQRSHQITIPNGAIHLKVTLSWTDQHGQPNAYKALVNDLDLVLEHPASSQTWQPWVLNSFPHADSLRKPAIRKRDTLNNHEQITINTPPPGVYNIKILGTSIPILIQEYSIAWQFDTVDHCIFSYPVKGDVLDPTRKNTLRWESTLTDTATLEYRLNNGNWQTVAHGVQVSNKYFQWQPPDTTAAIQLRLKTTQRFWLSDTAGISKNLLINTGFNCSDSFLIYWQKAKVDRYRVYRLGEKYMEPFITLSDTALIQLKQNNPYSFFSVAPLLPLQIEGRRAYTFDYRQQQVACYISGFIADPSGTNAARLNLQLGTTYQVAKIAFEKLTASGFSAVREIAPVTGNQFIINTPANNGLNVYRAKVTLQNGTTYYTQPEQVLLFGTEKYYVFPNPIQPGATLNIMDADPDNREFRLYDVFGRMVMKASLSGFRNQLRMPLLQRGVYFYVIMQANDRTLNGRLIVQ
ncbi:MAG: S8 family serine peptidase [Chitinophagaceae bacterium]|nr:S8 family serine peptidase [Chitinophagaceae bacterium]